ncbi:MULTISPECIES: hypothetical protein [Clostridium]|uniref:Transporter n=1 Tax=Clostridium ragsdalei P11 TaxID=1353534 RepID=A0A1A6AS30_9CLOT|nr:MULTISPECIES: hypothetical protein [Clostridium]OBR92874.1 hypothetical protein CLRAG_21680 [Clostridium ragsdalei P11]QXE18970.1 hypothetical protein B5S50_09060 [Clostridium sp. 001]
MYDYDYFRFDDDAREDDEPEELDYLDDDFVCPYLQFSSNHTPMCMSRQRDNFPPGPPPANVPQAPQNLAPGSSTKFVDPGSIRRCLFKFVYIWPNRGNGFWAWLTHVGRRSISGYRWHRNRWVYFGMDLRQIRSFMCR